MEWLWFPVANGDESEDVGLDCAERPDASREAAVRSSSSSSDNSSEDEVRVCEIVPNVLFFVGSVMYVWLAIHDLREEEASVDYDEDDVSSSWDAFRVAYAMAASTYVVSAAVEFCVACLARESAAAQEFIGDIALAATFGIAAMCELFGVILQNDDHPEPQYAADTASVHVYLLNAILAVSGQRLSFATTPLALVGAGNILFLIGSIIDAAISYFYSPETSDEMWDIIAWCSLGSASLWLIDAILYLISDCLVFRIQSRQLQSYQVPLLVTLSDGNAEAIPHEE